MDSPRQILLLPSPEHVQAAAPIFTQTDCVYANGSLPDEAKGRKDTIICGPQEWVDAMLTQVMLTDCPRVRWAYGDITQLGTPPLKGLQALIGSNEYRKDEPSSAPQADAAPSAAPSVVPAEPAGAEHFDEPDEDEAAEAALRSIRQASSAKTAAHKERVAENDEPIIPVDFWGEAGTASLPELLPEYMPAEIAPYVMDQANRAGVDPAQVALNCYVACAALIRTGIELQMHASSDDGRTWREKPILWGAVVGDPSTGKGPALDIALHKFHKISTALRAKNEAEWEEYDIQVKIHEKKMQKYITDAATSVSAVRPGLPLKPPRERLWTDDATKEVVAKLITENPRGKIAIIKDELSAWFGGFDAYGNGKSDKDRPDWLSFYESKERYIDRAMEGRSYHVPSWGGIILGGIQPDVLGRIANKLGSDGMLQRFQIIISKPKRQVEPRKADTEAMQTWHRIMENLSNMHAAGQSITLSTEAAAFMADRVKWISHAMQAGVNPGLVAALGKWEGLFGRLMITSHCIQCAAVGMPIPAPQVSLTVAEQVWKWMRYLLWPHAIQFYSGTMDASSERSSLVAFANFVLARDLREIKPYNLSSKWTHYQRNMRTIQQRREFWDAVVMSGWATPAGEINRQTQIASRYVINPDVFDGRFSEQSELARSQASRYRDIMHPDFKQSREPGEEG